MRVLTVVLVAAVVLSGCADIGSVGPEEGLDSALSGNASVFCRSWPDARLQLLDVVRGETSFRYQQDEISFTRFLSGVDSTVPIDVRDEWNRVHATYLTLADLAFITGYSEGTIRAPHLEMAFGESSPEAVLAKTEANIAAIDEWAATACGDFCSRWPALQHLMGFEESSMWRDLSQHIDADEALIAVGERLAPDEIAIQWNILTELVAGYFALARHIDFDGENRPDGEAWTSMVEEYLGTSFDEARMTMDVAREEVSQWVQANCDAIPTDPTASGGPGSLALWPTPQDQIANQMLFVALLLPGTDFATNRSPSAMVAARCMEESLPPGEWEWMLDEATRASAESGVDPEQLMREQFGEHLLRPLFAVSEGQEVDYATQDICGFVGYFSDQDAVRVPAGTYELFIGSYNGTPGAYGLYSVAPEYCVQFPVTVSGDTVVDLPQLEPCTLEPIGRAEEIARRTPPPFEPGGTLQIEVPSPMSQEGWDHCGLGAVLLPAGTTLNEVGRGEVWPSGAFNLFRHDVRQFDEGADLDRWIHVPGLVPVVELPPSGGAGLSLRPALEEGGSWDSRFPEPIPLAAGAYDLRVDLTCENEDAQDERDMYRRCGFATVEIAGATIVEMPELGACP